MEPGDTATVVVSFIEDRNGRALVRLPNGSKTSLAYPTVTPTTASSDDSACRRCGRDVVRNAAMRHVLEGMHWACFHYEFEHDGGAGDPDVACGDPSCPARAFDQEAPPPWKGA